MIMLRLVDLLNTLLGQSPDRWHEVPQRVEVVIHEPR